MFIQKEMKQFQSREVFKNKTKIIKLCVNVHNVFRSNDKLAVLACYSY